MTSQGSGHLLHNILLFGRLLHELGISVNPGKVIDLLQALAHVDVGCRSDFYHTSRCLLVQRREDLPIFEMAFNQFWRRHLEGAAVLELSASAVRRRDQRVLTVSPPLQETERRLAKETTSSEGEEAQPVVEVSRTYSRQELLQHKDFGELTGQELDEIRQLMSQMVWDLGQRRTRRQKPGRGDEFDLRRSLRRNLRYGGELLEWSRRRPKLKPRPLVVIADISGSMDRYSKLLLRFILSLAEGLTQPVEAFVFSTHLTRITRQLQTRDLDRALDEISQVVDDWAGGTRIGESLKTFNFDWGRRILGRGAIVLLISDGWDRGDPELLRQELGRLRRSCHRLIWLNPLLGSPEYEPLTRGMQAALPVIDDFLPVHNLSSLEDLAYHLARLPAERRHFNRSGSSLHGAAFISKRR